LTKVFLSYSIKDKTNAKRLAYYLERNGVTVWYDEFEIKLGQNIIEKIDKGLKESDYILILLSKDSLASKWVTYEIRNFVNQNKKIVTILLDDVEIPSYIMNSYTIDLRESSSIGFSNLLNYLKADLDKLSEKPNKAQNDINNSQYYLMKEKVNNTEAMPIPLFLDNGYLPAGIHVALIKDFITRFTQDRQRTKYKNGLINIFNFAKAKNVRYILFGGSFITSKSIPSDIDCVLVFQCASDIPSSMGKYVIDSTPIDVYYATLEDPNTLYTHIKFFSKNPNGSEVGIIKIELSNISFDELKKSFDNITPPIDQTEQLINVYQPRGMLVTVHGLLSKAEWNTEIAPIASSQGWIFAPYVYKTNWVDLLIRKNKRKKVVDDFRNWIFDMQMRHKGIPISVIAHSFGTYIIAEYLEGFNEEIPVRFQSIILTGSIVNREFDWHKHYINSKIVRVRNEIATNDNWVQKMPEGFLRLDTMFGQSGVKGFSKECEILKEVPNKIFDHNNVIRRDVVEQLWMPYLIANSNLDYLN